MFSLFINLCDDLQKKKVLTSDKDLEKELGMDCVKSEVSYSLCDQVIFDKQRVYLIKFLI